MIVVILLCFALSVSEKKTLLHPYPTERIQFLFAEHIKKTRKVYSHNVLISIFAEFEEFFSRSRTKEEEKGWTPSDRGEKTVEFGTQPVGIAASETFLYKFGLQEYNCDFVFLFLKALYPNEVANSDYFEVCTNQQKVVTHNTRLSSSYFLESNRFASLSEERFHNDVLRETGFVFEPKLATKSTTKSRNKKLGAFPPKPHSRTYKTFGNKRKSLWKRRGKRDTDEEYYLNAELFDESNWFLFVVQNSALLRADQTVFDQKRTSFGWAYVVCEVVKWRLFKKLGVLVEPRPDLLVKEFFASRANKFSKGVRLEEVFAFLSTEGSLVIETSGFDKEEWRRLVANNLEYLAIDQHAYLAPQKATGLGRIRLAGYKCVGTKPEDLGKSLLEGPVAIEIDAAGLAFYAGGVFTDLQCNKTNHYLLVVGKGVETDGEEFWVAKNSWGEDWGEKGFVKIAKEQGACHIGLRAIAVTFAEEPFRKYA